MFHLAKGRAGSDQKERWKRRGQVRQQSALAVAALAIGRKACGKLSRHGTLQPICRFAVEVMVAFVKESATAALPSLGRQQ